MSPLNRMTPIEVANYMRPFETPDLGARTRISWNEALSLGSASNIVGEIRNLEDWENVPMKNLRAIYLRDYEGDVVRWGDPERMGGVLRGFNMEHLVCKDDDDAYLANAKSGWIRFNSAGEIKIESSFTDEAEQPQYDQLTLELLISDLEKVQAVCRNRRLEKVPDVAMDYLLANYDLIEFYLKQVYTKLDEAQRIELQKKHIELHYSAVKDSWYPYAVEAIEQAKEFWGVTQSRAFADVDEDRIDCLLRVLRYAKYCPLDLHNYQLLLSPIEKWGI